jgi:hypothetical protein
MSLKPADPSYRMRKPLPAEPNRAGSSHEKTAPGASQRETAAKTVGNASVPSPRKERLPSETGKSRAELDFMRAMDQYKKASGRMFPTWSEILEVLKSLGYEKLTDGDQTSKR